MLKKEELAKLDHGKLNQEVISSKKTMFEVRFKVRGGQSKEQHKIKELRKYIAQVKTAQTAQKLKEAK